MKKMLFVALLLMMLAVQVNGIQSQGVEEEQVALLVPQDTISPISRTNSGQGTFYTHPEFSNIITTTVTTAANNTDDGLIFLGAINQFYGGPSAAMIMDNNGDPVYIKTLNGDPFVGDVKKQTVNGTDYFTFHAGSNTGGWTYGTAYVYDQSYQLVRTWDIDNGFGADVHEFILLENGNAILMAYEPIPFDLSPYGGPVDGTLIEIILQEQDAGGNVVFEWRGTDHMPIGDTEANLATTNPVDFLHTNAIEVDNDGNWLLSHRNFSEITKINRQTGEIIWRMGGAGNEFTFTNDEGFYNQHSIRRLDNGDLLLFDNGNQHIPPHSRAIQYIVDENAKTVTRYGMYPGDTSIYSLAMGSVQRLSNGNTMIGWGTTPRMTEVIAGGPVALDILLGSPSYRVFRFPWEGTPIDPPRAVLQSAGDPTAVTVYTSWNGATDIVSYDVYAGATSGTMSLVTNVPRDGFETEIPLTSLPDDTCFFQTKPIHDDGNSTPFSNMMFRLDLEVCWNLLDHAYLPASFKQ
jgi:hypothetical protein